MCDVRCNGVTLAKQTETETAQAQAQDKKQEEENKLHADLDVDSFRNSLDSIESPPEIRNVVRVASHFQIATQRTIMLRRSSRVAVAARHLATRPAPKELAAAPKRPLTNQRAHRTDHRFPDALEHYTPRTFKRMR